MKISRRLKTLIVLGVPTIGFILTAVFFIVIRGYSSPQKIFEVITSGAFLWLIVLVIIAGPMFGSVDVYRPFSKRPRGES